jgi:hypothetical protein
MNKKFILCLVLAILSCALFVSAQEPVDDGTTTDDSQDDLRLFFYLKVTPNTKFSEKDIENLDFEAMTKLAETCFLSQGQAVTDPAILKENQVPKSISFSFLSTAELMASDACSEATIKTALGKSLLKFSKMGMVEAWDQEACLENGSLICGSVDQETKERDDQACTACWNSASMLSVGITLLMAVAVSLLF